MTPADPDDDNISPFPGMRERNRRARLKRAALHEEARLGRRGPAGGEPLLNLPPATRALMLAIAGVFLAGRAVAWLAGPDTAAQWMYALAFVPARYTGALPFGPAALVSPVTHMFLHGGWLHLGINALTLMAFGAGLERMTGAKKLLLLFFTTGLAGAFLHLALSPGIENPMIGASGAISGLFGALLVLMHDAGALGGGRRRGLAGIVFIWIGMSLVFGLMGMPGGGMLIAWATHIGGFLCGLALARRVARMRLS